MGLFETRSRRLHVGQYFSDTFYHLFTYFKENVVATSDYFGYNQSSFSDDTVVVWKSLPLGSDENCRFFALMWTNLGISFVCSTEWSLSDAVGPQLPLMIATRRSYQMQASFCFPQGPRTLYLLLIWLHHFL